MVILPVAELEAALVVAAEITGSVEAAPLDCALFTLDADAARTTADDAADETDAAEDAAEQPETHPLATRQ